MGNEAGSASRAAMESGMLEETERLARGFVQSETMAVTSADGYGDLVDE